MPECWKGTKDKVVWWRDRHMNVYVQKGHNAWMLKLNQGQSGVVEGLMHKCLSAERSSCLNVETEPRFSIYPQSPMCSFTLPHVLSRWSISSIFIQSIMTKSKITSIFTCPHYFMWRSNLPQSPWRLFRPGLNQSIVTISMAINDSFHTPSWEELLN